jgi:hypothetical protein
MHRRRPAANALSTGLKSAMRPRQGRGEPMTQSSEADLFVRPVGDTRDANSWTVRRSGIMVQRIPAIFCREGDQTVRIAFF